MTEVLTCPVKAAHFMGGASLAQTVDNLEAIIVEHKDKRRLTGPNGYPDHELFELQPVP